MIYFFPRYCFSLSFSRFLFTLVMIFLFSLMFFLLWIYGLFNLFTFMMGRRERAVGLLPPILILISTSCISCISYLYFRCPFLFLFLPLLFLLSISATHSLAYLSLTPITLCRCRFIPSAFFMLVLPALMLVKVFGTGGHNHRRQWLGDRTHNNL